MRNPDVNETLEGWWILHRMFAFDRRRWQRQTPMSRDRISREAATLFASMKEREHGDLGLAQIVGHKADVMVTHYAKNYDGLAEVQAAFDACELAEFFDPRDSFTSVLELGLYEATARIHASLEERALKRFSPEWNAAFDEMIAEQARQPRNASRLWARIPDRRYTCFYPMDKKREGADNWYSQPFEARAGMMLDHGKIGRTFHGLVTQVISGAIGFDDYEWGVDLYADDPLVFKNLIYEMRFDEASARFAAFGPFWSGIQFAPERLPAYLESGVGVAPQRE